MDPSDVSMRVVADHMRAMTFLIADGVVPSNEYARLRAAEDHAARDAPRQAPRHDRAVPPHARRHASSREFGDAYPELQPAATSIAQVVRSEEDRFDAVLTGGLPRLERR